MEQYYVIKEYLINVKIEYVVIIILQQRIVNVIYFYKDVKQKELDVYHLTYHVHHMKEQNNNVINLVEIMFNVVII
jgi:hypothetical protein